MLVSEDCGCVEWVIWSSCAVLPCLYTISTRDFGSQKVRKVLKEDIETPEQVQGMSPTRQIENPSLYLASAFNLEILVVSSAYQLPRIGPDNNYKLFAPTSDLEGTHARPWRRLSVADPATLYPTLGW
jgi:hypothetical protein